MFKNKTLSKTFIGFIIVSALIWLLITFSKEYVTVVNLSVKYSNLPKDKVFASDPTHQIDMLVKGSGFKIVSANFSDINIDLSAENFSNTKNNQFFYLPKNKQNILQKVLPNGLILQQIVTDTVFLNVKNLATKKVPVVLNTDIKYQIGYDLVDEIKVIPDSIVISGSDSLVNEMKAVIFEKLILENINQNISKKVNLVKPNGFEAINYFTNQVTVEAKVDRFTESEIAVPITVINLPKNTTINTFPKEVKITFRVGLTNFQNINENSFVVECDYQTSKEAGVNYLVPKIVKKSSLVSNIKITPSKVDFLIHN